MGQQERTPICTMKTKRFGIDRKAEDMFLTFLVGFIFTCITIAALLGNNNPFGAVACIILVLVLCSGVGVILIDVYFRRLWNSSDNPLKLKLLQMQIWWNKHKLHWKKHAFLRTIQRESSELRRRYSRHVLFIRRQRKALRMHLRSA